MFSRYSVFASWGHILFAPQHCNICLEYWYIRYMCFRFPINPTRYQAWIKWHRLLEAYIALIIDPKSRWYTLMIFVTLPSIRKNSDIMQQNALGRKDPNNDSLYPCRFLLAMKCAYIPAASPKVILAFFLWLLVLLIRYIKPARHSPFLLNIIYFTILLSKIIVFTKPSHALLLSEVSIVNTLFT